MPIYKNIDGDSGILSYECGSDWIEVEFESGRSRFYRYTYASAGSVNVEEMKRLAEMGDGLNSFIMHNVRTRYASKR